MKHNQSPYYKAFFKPWWMAKQEFMEQMYSLVAILASETGIASSLDTPKKKKIHG